MVLHRLGMAIVAILIMSSTGYSQDDGMVTIIVEKNQNVREIAQKYLDNPDLWPDILHANNMMSVHELLPGMQLKIPVKMILKVEETVNRSRDLIQKATQAGARILAADAISSAIFYQNRALDERRAGRWKIALEMALRAESDARQALEISQKERDISIEAVLDSLVGKVQNRKPADLYWKNAVEKAALIEMERLRTLSRSMAEILFKDNSRIRLNENAQVVIENMREDRLNRQQKSSMVLQKGDIYALLGSVSQKKQFDLKIPNIETKVESRKFWVDQGAKITRFANYEGKFEISSAGETVVLYENQGTSVEENKAPAPPTALLPPPEKLIPDNYTTIYVMKVELKWTPVEAASAYWLEVSKEKSFRKPVINQKDISRNSFETTLREEGLYYWRVATIDHQGLPGPKSKTNFFKLFEDKTPPYLVVDAPSENDVVNDNLVRVSGNTEKNATITGNEKQVPVSSEGRFDFEATLDPGKNVIAVTAIDAAGNTTTILRTIRYIPDSKIPIEYDSGIPQREAKHFVSAKEIFSLKGRTIPGVALSVRSEQNPDYQIDTRAGDTGDFILNMSLHSPEESFTVTAAKETGDTSRDRFHIEIDKTPPRIVLNEEPPMYTSEKTLKIAGVVEDGRLVKIGDQEIHPAADGSFSAAIELGSGANAVRIIAEDIVGNVAVWKQDVVLDQRPPEYLGYSLSKKFASGGDEIVLEVRVRDDTGIKGAANYLLSVGDDELSGYLRICPDRNCYRGKIVLPAHVRGRIVLKEIRLEDYIGNSKNYVLQ